MPSAQGDCLVCFLLQMTKKIKKLEKETAMYRSRWESSNKALLEMAEEVSFCFYCQGQTSLSFYRINASLLKQLVCRIHKITGCFQESTKKIIFSPELANSHMVMRMYFFILVTVKFNMKPIPSRC